MKEIFMILVSAILVDNFVLSKFMGICPFLGVSKKLDSAVGMGLAVTFVMIMASAVTYPIYRYLLLQFDLTYLNTLVFILVIAALVQFVQMVLRKISSALYQGLGVYLPLITTNCAVLGVALLNVQNEYSVVQGVVNGLGTALGFLIAIVIMAGIRERIEHNDIPTAFRGTPIVLITAGLMAIAFFGFSGML